DPSCNILIGRLEPTDGGGAQLELCDQVKARPVRLQGRRRRRGKRPVQQCSFGQVLLCRSHALVTGHRPLLEEGAPVRRPSADGMLTEVAGASATEGAGLAGLSFENVTTACSTLLALPLSIAFAASSTPSWGERTRPATSRASAVPSNRQSR